MIYDAEDIRRRIEHGFSPETCWWKLNVRIRINASPGSRIAGSRSGRPAPSAGPYVVRGLRNYSGFNLDSPEERSEKYIS